MKKISAVQELRECVSKFKVEGPLALVPTMGFLHDGHLSLVRLAKSKGARVVVSIFVNPTQFNDVHDYEKYPVDINRDCDLLESEGVDAVFIPSVDVMYPSGQKDFSCWVVEDRFASQHEGEFRPGHFRGVTTAVAKLFNLVQPDLAVFGEKDFQQLRIIERMTSELHFPVQIIPAKLVRDPDGLAMSSRNARLSEQGRKAALLISQGLFAARKRFESGEHNSTKLIATVWTALEGSSLIKPQYVRMIDSLSLTEQLVSTDRSRLVLAVFVEGIRLIDTMPMAGAI